MSLHKSSMLVKMTIRQWDGFKKDRVVSERVDVEYQTRGSAGNYNKRLLDKSVLGPLQKVINRIRADHKFYTIPWCYDGVDLLPSKLFFEYTSVMRGHKDTFDTAVDNLVQQYPIYKANQVTNLGGMFNPEDYPHRDELKARFGLTFNYFPVPDEGHYVVDLEARDIAKLEAELVKTLSDTQKAALKGLYARVNDLVEHVHERLMDPENVFRDSMMNNLTMLTEVLPGLNIFGDETLNVVAKRIQEQVLFASSDRLREDPDLRKRVADSAYDISTLLKAP